MNIIHNNQNNISAYHFLSLHNKENIDDYYLENSSGKILSSEDIVKKDEKYIIREKCRGGSSLNQSGNSFIITIGSSIIYAIITIIYYNYYITNILIGKYCDSPDEIPNAKNIPGAFSKNSNNKQKGGIAIGRKIKIIEKIRLVIFGLPHAILVAEFKNNGAMSINMKTANMAKLRIEPRLVCVFLINFSFLYGNESLIKVS